MRAGAIHGAAPRGHGSAAGAEAEGPSGRYGKLFKRLRPAELDELTLDELATKMEDIAEAFSGQREILHPAFPAGFTYFGQFVDHDITFDPTLATQRIDGPLVNFRTPRFDLDSLYGAGPEDHPYLYDNKDYDVRGTKLLTDPIKGGASRDLPRNRQGLALIGDPRNDEHRIISQLHLLFIQFHNVVVDYLRDTVHVPGSELFARARDVVRWHYQWIVTHEYLRLVVGRNMARSVLKPGGPGEPETARLEYYPTEGRPFMPLEFSAAAFRFGHSLVRPRYFINDDFRESPPIIDAEPTKFSLTGERRMIAELVIEWKHFFALPPEDGVKVKPQMALELNPVLSLPLFDLPHHRGSLARLNLERGRKDGLPSGQAVARHLGCKELSDDALYLDGFASVDGSGSVDGFSPATRARIRSAAPLWYYVLCEPVALPVGHPERGVHLGPVGGRIVAETLVGLLVGDPESYIHRASPPWKPHLGPRPGDFTMADLVLIAQGKIAPGSATPDD